MSQKHIAHLFSTKYVAQHSDLVGSLGDENSYSYILKHQELLHQEKLKTAQMALQSELGLAIIRFQLDNLVTGAIEKIADSIAGKTLAPDQKKDQATLRRTIQEMMVLKIKSQAEIKNIFKSNPEIAKTMSAQIKTLIDLVTENYLSQFDPETIAAQPHMLRDKFLVAVSEAFNQIYVKNLETLDSRLKSNGLHAGLAQFNQNMQNQGANRNLRFKHMSTMIIKDLFAVAHAHQAAFHPEPSSEKEKLLQDFMRDLKAVNQKLAPAIAVPVFVPTPQAPAIHEEVKTHHPAPPQKKSVFGTLHISARSKQGLAEIVITEEGLMDAFKMAASASSQLSLSERVHTLSLEIRKLLKNPAIRTVGGKILERSIRTFIQSYNSTFWIAWASQETEKFFKQRDFSRENLEAYLKKLMQVAIRINPVPQAQRPAA